jgi:glutamate/tyrosine decarboxylase-like PLP-dependent enzyme
MSTPQRVPILLLKFPSSLISVAEHLHTRCVSILADLWHAPSAKQAIGTATTGSSEAIQLGGLAMKRIWQDKRKAAGKSIHEPGYGNCVSSVVSPDLI